MRIKKLGFLLLVIVSFLTKTLYSQLPVRLMGNATYNDCRAKFYDDGGLANDYSFTPGGSTKTLQIITGHPVITMTFNPSGSFTEIKIGDVIKFHNAFPPTAGNQIAGPYTNIPNTGTISNVVSTTGTLVVVFSEDGVIQGKGWDAGWYSSAPAPIPPTVSVSPVPSCNANQITLVTTQGVVCDSLKPNYFIVNGPMFPGVTSVSAMPCSSGTTTVIQLNLTQPINQNCNYTINSTIFQYDKCDSVYKYPNIINTFSIGNCPIQASLNVAPINTVCAYSCSTTVQAVVPSSVCLNLSYAWDPPLPPTAGPHNVCPTVTTVYNCTVTEQSTSTFTVISKTIYVIDPKINPVASPTVCQGVNFNLTGTPAGGVWLGPGITNSLTGFFCSGCTSAGVKTLTYQVGSCITTTQITVIQINAGSADAACVGAPAFTVSGGLPLGGTWYGSPNITPGGVFTPSAVGTYTVVYAFGSCTSVPKQINVTNAITVPTTAINLCRSQWYTYLYTGYGITPFGGRYSKVGPGITNNVYGTFTPSLAGVGTHVITYSLATGCSATFAVNVLDIDVSPTTATTCPTRAPFIPTVTAGPSGGTWSCSTLGSVLNASTGLYNPPASSVNSHTDILIYTATNGCKDTLVMHAIKTNMVRDSVFFCVNSSTLQLTNNLATFSYSPPGGLYSGPGVSLQGINYIFNPAIAGPGVHTVYYDNNTCTDSVKMVVYPNSPGAYSPTVCSTHPTFVINPPMLPGSTWVGPGITTPSLGVFTPSSVGAGNYLLTQNNKGGCGYTVNVNVYQFQAAAINTLSNAYCYTNNNYSFVTVPSNGTLSAPPSFSAGILNPSVIGAGTYTMSYAYGEGACLTSTSKTITVHPQLTTSYTLTTDTVCLGESSRITVRGNGGLPTVTQYTYTWNQGLISLNSHIVVPNVSTVYSIVTSDGCSDPVVNTFTVIVSPQYFPSFATSSIQCFGEPGQATVNIVPSGIYSYTWNTSPVQSSSVLIGTAGKSYLLKIRNTETGCVKDTSIKIPGYNAIKALFSPNPNMSCIPFENNTVTFIDQSNGAISGTWSFNGNNQAYVKGQNPQYLFAEPGNYSVKLTVYNEGNCSSEYSIPICILESTEFFIPDIFSPNKDGANDELFVRGNGIKEMRFMVYDRWGNKVFETSDQKIGWDGTYKGKDAEIGVYAYYLEATMFDDKKVSKKGDITLVR